MLVTREKTLGILWIQRTYRDISSRRITQQMFCIRESTQSVYHCVNRSVKWECGVRAVRGCLETSDHRRMRL